MRLMSDLKPSVKQEQYLDRPASPLKRLIVGILVMMLTAGLLGTLQLLKTRAQSLQQAEINSLKQADILKNYIGEMMQKTDLLLVHVVDELVHQRATGGIQEEVLGSFIKRQLQLMPELDSLMISDASGRVTFGRGQDPDVPVTMAERDYFMFLRDHADTGMIISRPDSSKFGKKPVINCVRRISFADGTFGGVVSAVLPLQQFNELFINISVGPHGSISLRRDDLTLITRHSAINSAEKPEENGTAQVPQAWRTLLDRGELQSGSYTADNVLDGVRRIHSYRRIPAYPLYVNVGLAMDDVLAESRKEMLAFAIVFGFFLCMAGVLVWQVQRNWQKTLKAEKVLKRNYERLELMQEVSQYHAISVQELLEFSLEKVIALTESSIGYIYHYDEELQQFILNAWSKDVMAACNVAEPQSLYQLERTGIWGEVVRQRKPLVVNDYASANPLKKGYPDGHVPLSRFLSIPIFDNDKIVAVVGVANKALPYDQTDVIQLTLMMEGVWKIAARLLLEEHILRAGNEWQSTFDAINDSIALIDAEQRVIRCNRSTCKVLGLDFADIIGQSCCRMFHGSGATLTDCPTERAKISLQSETSTILHHDRWLEVTVDPIVSGSGLLTGAVHIVRDVTDNRQAEESLREMQAQMMQNDKLATIGQLAAGVAHEINNPMGFVGSNMATLSKYVDKYNRYIDQLEREILACSAGILPERIQELRQSLKLEYVMRDIKVLVDESNEGIDRIKRIVQDLKTFSRTDTLAVGSADLNRCLDSTINIVINEIKYVAELKREYGDLPKISCNAQQINQVFMNLLINAAHAIQAKGEEVGEIVIRTWCDQDDVFVAVSDTGCGILPENRGRIFDAFYTTKEVGKGTGLGLSISSGIIRKHGGEISITSEIDVGTTFTIRLPIKSEQHAEEVPL